MNAILKYPGSKWSLAEWIIGHFPPHHSYLEPFFGSGAVPPPFATALVRANLPEWCGEEITTMEQLEKAVAV